MLDCKTNQPLKLKSSTPTSTTPTNTNPPQTINGNKSKGAGLAPDQRAAFGAAKAEFWLFLVEGLTRLCEHADEEVGAGGLDWIGFGRLSFRCRSLCVEGERVWGVSLFWTPRAKLPPAPSSVPSNRSSRPPPCRRPPKQTLPALPNCGQVRAGAAAALQRAALAAEPLGVPPAAVGRALRERVLPALEALAKRAAKGGGRGAMQRVRRGRGRFGGGVNPKARLCTGGFLTAAAAHTHAKHHPAMTKK